jgi:peptide/nickel transport system permease protein
VKSLGRYILDRVFQMLPILFFVSVVTFVLLYIAPGHPLAYYLNPSLSPEELSAKSEALGLNQPLYIQYFKWVSGLFRGKLGWSILRGRPVEEVIMERVPATLLLMGTSLIISVSVGLLLAVISAIRPYSLLDSFLTFLTFAGLSVPGFFLGILAIYIFSGRLEWFPVGGISTAGQDFSFFDLLRHLFLPSSVLSFINICGFLRYTRSGLLEVMDEEFITTARAKGLSETAVVIRHGLRNALAPTVTLLGIALPSLIGGASVIEVVFSWPGVGTLMMTALYQRDFPVLMGCMLITTFFTLVGGLLADIVYALLDPRVNIGG